MHAHGIRRRADPIVLDLLVRHPACGYGSGPPEIAFVFDAGTTSGESLLIEASKLAWKIATSSTLKPVRL
jgi:hypothetical protein